jgi:hypothetical protein
VWLGPDDHELVGLRFMRQRTEHLGLQARIQLVPLIVLDPDGRGCHQEVGIGSVKPGPTIDQHRGRTRH